MVVEVFVAHDVVVHIARARGSLDTEIAVVGPALERRRGAERTVRVARGIGVLELQALAFAHVELLSVERQGHAASNHRVRCHTVVDRHPIPARLQDGHSAARRVDLQREASRERARADIQDATGQAQLRNVGAVVDEIHLGPAVQTNDDAAPEVDLDASAVGSVEGIARHEGCVDAQVIPALDVAALVGNIAVDVAHASNPGLVFVRMT